MSAQHDLSRWAHQHRYGIANAQAERGTRWVLWITLATMVIEITTGWLTHSMAVLADGWHMSSHALAIGLATFAYAAARRYADDPRFAFGTWKIEILAGYTSAIVLLGVAGTMLFASLERLISPEPVLYGEAMIVAVAGLLINLACALILDGAHDHQHTHDHAHPHDHHHDHHHDLNLKAAYVHVLTDALTSVLAILALAGGWWLGWYWLDPAMGLIGAILVAVWARKLLIQTGAVLLDREMDHPVVAEVREVVSQLADGDVDITDLHVWRVGNSAYACALSLLTHNPSLTPLQVREALAIHQELMHVTVEIHHCDTCPQR